MIQGEQEGDEDGAPDIAATTDIEEIVEATNE